MPTARVGFSQVNVKNLPSTAMEIAVSAKFALGMHGHSLRC